MIVHLYDDATSAAQLFFGVRCRLNRRVHLSAVLRLDGVEDADFQRAMARHVGAEEGAGASSSIIAEKQSV